MLKTERPTLDIEETIWCSGAKFVAGIDEVGVGSLAGPVTAAAVVLTSTDDHSWFKEVNDSKKLSPARRVILHKEICNSAIFSTGWSSNEEVDLVGISEARRQACIRALSSLSVSPDAVISDALQLPWPNVTSVIRADSKSISVAAASIIAKVVRDSWMVDACERLPGYGFCKHKGYLTAKHKQALYARGSSSIHRLTWSPISEWSFSD